MPIPFLAAGIGLMAIGGIGSGLINASRQKRLNQKDRATARQLGENVKQIETLVKDQKLSIDEGLAQLNSMIDQQTGAMKNLITQEAGIATQKATYAFQTYLEDINLQLDKARETATDAQKRAIDQQKRSIAGIQKQANEMRKEQLKQAVQRGFEGEFGTAVGRKLAEDVNKKVVELEEQGVKRDEAYAKAIEEIETSAMREKGRATKQHEFALTDIEQGKQKSLTNLILGATAQKTQAGLQAGAEKRGLEASSMQQIMQLQNMQTELTAFQPTFGQSFLEGVAPALGGLSSLGGQMLTSKLTS